MYSVFCLKNEQRQQGPPLPRLEAESSLGTYPQLSGGIEIAQLLHYSRGTTPPTVPARLPWAATRVA